MDIFAYLKANPLLAGFTDDGVKIVQAMVQARPVEAGSPIFVEKMLGESAFLLGHGEVRLTVNRGGEEKDLGALLAPDAFGELALMQPGPRRVSAHARGTVLLFEILRRDFVTMQKQRPQACQKLLSNIQERFAQKALAAAPALERLADSL